MSECIVEKIIVEDDLKMNGKQFIMYYYKCGTPYEIKFVIDEALFYLTGGEQESAMMIAKIAGKFDEALVEGVMDYFYNQKVNTVKWQDIKWQTIGTTKAGITFEPGVKMNILNPGYNPSNGSDAISSDHQAMADIRSLPGVMELAMNPARPDVKMKIFDIIVELNDKQKWSREKIADWLETLDVDLRFKTPDTRSSKQREIAVLNSQLAEAQKIVDKCNVALSQAILKKSEIMKKIITLQEETNEQD